MVVANISNLGLFEVKIIDYLIPFFPNETYVQFFYIPQNKEIDIIDIDEKDEDK